jgi:SAM-dependent methyltransferase
MSQDQSFKFGELLCPDCSGNLSVARDLAICANCTRRWKVIGGVPLLVSGLQSDKMKQTAQTFQTKWDHDPEAIKEERERIANKWFWRRFDFSGEHDFAHELQGRKRILDAGCGVGNLTQMHAKYCDENARVYGLDLTSSVRTIERAPRMKLVQGDLRRVPIEGEFDWIVSDGVLHHTDDTRMSLTSLVNRLAVGGDILFYVYKVKAPVREFVDDHIRRTMEDMTTDEAMELSEAIADIGRQLREANVEINVTKPIECLDIQAGKMDLQRWFYWHFMKCFWDDGGNVVASTLENFDWYHPTFAHRHTRAQVEGWLLNLNLDEISFIEEPSGFAVRARRIA